MTPQKSIFWSLLSRGLSYIFILAQGMIIARLVGPEGKGVQAKLMASASFFIFFLDFGLSNSINYFFNQKKISFDQTKRILKFIFSIQLILSILLFFVFKIPTLRKFFLPDNYFDTLFIWYIVLTIFLDTTRLSLNSFLMASLKFKWINWSEIVQSVFRLICYSCLYFFPLNERALYFVIGIDVITNLIMLLSLFIMHLKINKPVSEQDTPIADLDLKALLKMMAQYSFPLFLSNIVIYLNTRMDYWAIEKIQGLESLGYYSVAHSGSQLLTIVPAIIGAIIFSYMNKIDEEHKINFFGYYSRLNFSVLLTVSIIGALTAPILIPLLFGTKFNPSIPLFQLLLIVATIQSYKYLLGIYLQSINKNKLRLTGDALALVLNILFLFPTIKYFGLNGAIVLLFVGHIISIGYIHFTLRHSHFKNVNLFFIRRVELKTIFNIDNFFKLSR